MNTRLELLFERHHVSDKDRYEINQIFGLMPSDRQQNILKNFEILAYKLEEISNNLKIERELLLPKSIDRITKVLDEVKTERISNLKN